jgi:hypothetical protein
MNNIENFNPGKKMIEKYFKEIINKLVFTSGI